MPLRLDDGWNQIQFNLADFVSRAYGSNYVEALRVQVHANARIRRIFFSDKLYSEAELPPEFKLVTPAVSGFIFLCVAPSSFCFSARKNSHLFAHTFTSFIFSLSPGS